MTTLIDSPELADPRTQGPRPPYEQPAQPHPGSDLAMEPRPDCGEESYRGRDLLRGRRALVTGGDSGIGRAVAIAFAREGADVAIAHLPEEAEDADDTVGWIERAGRRALALPGDLGEEAHCGRVIGEVRERLGGLDLLVNNAAFQMSHDDLEEISSDEFARTWRTNVGAMFWLCRAALRDMPPGAAIINTASIQAYDPSPNLIAYAMTKAAIVNFTKGLAKSAMRRGVRVNAVAPGPVWTPLIPSTMPPEKVRGFGADTPFGRAAQPVEMAPLFVFLASNEARFVTGEVYGATGGQSPF